MLCIFFYNYLELLNALSFLRMRGGTTELMKQNPLYSFAFFAVTQGLARQFLTLDPERSVLDFLFLADRSVPSGRSVACAERTVHCDVEQGKERYEVQLEFPAHRIVLSTVRDRSVGQSPTGVCDGRETKVSAFFSCSGFSASVSLALCSRFPSSLFELLPKP